MTIYRWVLIFLLIAGTFLFHPRMKAFLFPLTIEANMNPRAFWQMREFSSLGQFTQGNYHINQKFLTEKYPQLASAEFDQVISYDSNRIKSVDVALEKNKAMVLLAEMGVGDLGINQNIFVDLDGSRWFIGLYDAQTARKTNGYFLEDKFLRDQVWLNISLVKTL